MLKNEFLSDRRQRLEALAERAYDLWGRILDAQMEYLVVRSPKPGPEGQPLFRITDGHAEYLEGAPRKLSASNPRLEEYDVQVDLARTLFERATWKAGTLPVAHHTMPAAPAVPQPNIAPKANTKRYRATRRSDEEIADYTTSVQDAMTAALDAIHHSYSPDETGNQKKRKFIAGDRLIHVKKGGETIEQKVRNRVIIEQDELSQVVLWSAQAAGPRHAPFLQTPADRAIFVLEMINMGRLDASKLMDGETLWSLIDEAAEKGLLSDADDPKITNKGFRHIKEITAQGESNGRGDRT